MGALCDPKLERFAQEFLKNLASGIARSKAAALAGKAVGYRGDANNRRRSNRTDVKVRLAELAAPVQAEAEADVIATIESASSRLSRIIHADIDLADIKASDLIAAVRQMALMHGWNAPERHEIFKRDAADWSRDELVAFLNDARARSDGAAAAAGGEREPDSVH